MYSVLLLIDTAIDVYIWLLIISVILSWLVTFNIVNTSNRIRWKRFSYRVVRNPFVLFVIGPLFLTLIQERCPSSNGNRRERQSVWWMNLAILAMVIGLSAVFGIVPYMLIQLIITS